MNLIQKKYASALLQNYIHSYHTMDSYKGCYGIILTYKFMHINKDDCSLIITLRHETSVHKVYSIPPEVCNIFNLHDEMGMRIVCIETKTKTIKEGAGFYVYDVLEIQIL